MTYPRLNRLGICMAAVQKGLDQLDKGEAIPHDEVKRQLASWLTN
jgi:predicted transcriptional regulator